MRLGDGLGEKGGRGTEEGIPCPRPAWGAVSWGTTTPLRKRVQEGSMPSTSGLTALDIAHCFGKAYDASSSREAKV
jgi:hypothetical protein